MGGIKIKLTSATVDDCMLVYMWINEPHVRNMSFSSDIIPLNSHKKWFQSKLADKNHIYYIARSDDGNAVGQIRFAINGNEADVSVLIDKNYVGQGFGKQIIREGTKKLFYSRDNVSVINAYVKIKNIASKKAFLNSNYSFNGIVNVSGTDSYHLVYSKDKFLQCLEKVQT